jgi:hypothetical protein
MTERSSNVKFAPRIRERIIIIRVSGPQQSLPATVVSVFLRRCKQLQPRLDEDHPLARNTAKFVQGRFLVVTVLAQIF